ncbi:hypothetical protein LX15_002513 [Streptoalloteichus tenebrarius]|uniref:Uncharacterized protein n=1 Tax=Streptoalloteichus tenebrarius (strain ATCC 17920 / DSM 40477 / JCM 4838 / CBS 697.72 / NBRC 16177 / NCIMB 11028 / NRRL B-12390 / A12253. 1 / ISP 5477) TaxID=1933 RepID=A0ABT1HTS9_STRSD|nr:hypothetical protein [Streptoalloteichus tenebrarius]
MRDFQVAAAALTGLPVTHVYYWATSLNAEFGGRDAVDATGQNAPGVIAMLDAIGGELTPGDRIRFPRPGWADSILEYFWGLGAAVARILDTVPWACLDSGVLPYSRPELGPAVGTGAATAEPGAAGCVHWAPPARKPVTEPPSCTVPTCCRTRVAASRVEMPRSAPVNAPRT